MEAATPEGGRAAPIRRAPFVYALIVVDAVVTIPVVVAAEVIGALRSRWRWLWVLYPATVAFGVLLMAEHYLLDTLGGAAVGLVALMVVRSLPARVLSGSERDHQTNGISRRVVHEYSTYSGPRR
jgi:hypothetical protein